MNGKTEEQLHGGMITARQYFKSLKTSDVFIGMETIREVLTDFGKQSQDLIREALANNRINASGRLSESVSYKVKDGGFVFVLTVTANDYIFSALQTGRGPTKNPGPGELRIKIAEWVREKPGLRIPKGLTEKQFINATANKIHKFGTRLWVTTGSQGRTSGELEKIFSDKRIDSILNRLATKAEEGIIDTFVKFS